MVFSIFRRQRAALPEPALLANNSPALVLSCPHCGAERIAFEIFGVFALPHCRLAAAAICRGCMVPVALELGCMDGGHQLATDGIEAAIRTGTIHVTRIFPDPPKPDIPAHLPPDIESAFRQGEANRLLGEKQTTAAAAMYRRVIDRTTQTLAPDAAKERSFRKRFDLLEERRLITRALRDWAHEIVQHGNAALHEDSDPTVADITEIAAITRMLLIYVFEMPERVRALRDQQGAS